jgi:hypothetical protein
MRLKELVERLNTGEGLQLVESILVPEVDLAFKDWVTQADGNWMLIGGIVVGYYTKPRTTMDVDVLYPSKAEIPDAVIGFKRTRPMAFQHNKTHVEIEVISPEGINLPIELYQQVYDTSIMTDNIRVPSANGLVALKVAANRPQDVADIYAICQKQDISLKGYSVPLDKLKEIEQYLKIKIDI